MENKSADSVLKKVTKVSLITGGAVVLGFVIRHFYKMYVHDKSENNALDVVENASSYATELYIALAKGKWFTAADKGNIIDVYNRIPNKKMLDEVEKKYKSQSGNTLNEDLKKTFTLQEYNILQNIVKDNETKWDAGRKKIFSQKKNLPAQEAQTRTVAFNAEDLAKNLYQNAQEKNIAKVLEILRQIFTKSEYLQVNFHYKQIPSWYKTSKTIVTDLLDYAFKYYPNTKEQIKKELIRIGLKVNPSTGTWSLDGIRM